MVKFLDQIRLGYQACGVTLCIILLFQPIELTLLDIPPMMTSLGGVVMELQDCALTLLKGK